MFRKPQEEDGADLRGRIKAAACALFDANGFDNTTVDDVLVQVRIDEQRFSSYFRSLDELLEVVWSEL